MELIRTWQQELNFSGTNFNSRRLDSMKKLVILALAGCVAASVTLYAQEAGKSCNMGKMSSSGAAPLKTLKGTVKSEGDKISFVNDADQKSWDVMNPETLKDHV